MKLSKLNDIKSNQTTITIAFLTTIENNHLHMRLGRSPETEASTHDVTGDFVDAWTCVTSLFSSIFVDGDCSVGVAGEVLCKGAKKVCLTASASGIRCVGS